MKNTAANLLSCTLPTLRRGLKLKRELFPSTGQSFSQAKYESSQFNLSLKWFDYFINVREMLFKKEVML